ncbi:MAG: DUF4440 domain-containing protein [Pyrinomonadaceae bacterium]|nr:DUF4440 domain-containing protein [Pyrinomonadaceae bacterium]
MTFEQLSVTKTGSCAAILACLFMLTFSAQQLLAQEATRDSNMSPAEAEINKASGAFSSAYVRGDVDAIRELYTEDGVILPPGRTIRGKKKIGNYFAPRPNRVNISHSMKSSELKIDGDIAIDIGMWHNKWKIGDAEAQSASGQYLVVWRRGSDGRWRIQYDIWHRPNE